MTRIRVFWIAMVLPHIGCALFFKGDAFVPRYFSPESSATPTEPIAASGLELRLGHVNAAAYIKDRIVYRDSAYEIGYYEERCWTEMPDAYVRRELNRALFDRRGIRQIMYGPGTTLDVDVVAFEEVRVPQHVGRVELRYVVVGDRTVQLARSITVERAVAPAAKAVTADAIVKALSTAMVDAVDMVAESTIAELRAEAATPRSKFAAAVQ
jgi:cholesterol transport system auxiliary component